MGIYTLTTGQTGAKNHAICDGAVIIAQITPMGYPLGEGWSYDSEKYAYLLAAAPALLDACKLAIACMRDEYPEHVLETGDYPAFRALQAAINKAEGAS